MDISSAPSIENDRPRRRAEASQYLFDKFGIRRAPTTLAKLAVVGGGPIFHTVGRIPLYRPTDLDVWAQSITSAPKTSTSQKDAA